MDFHVPPHPDRTALPVVRADHRLVLMTVPSRRGKTYHALQTLQTWPGPVLAVGTDWGEVPPSLSKVVLDGLPGRTALPTPQELAQRLFSGERLVLDFRVDREDKGEMGKQLTQLLTGLLEALSLNPGGPVALLLDDLGHNLPPLDLLAVLDAAAQVQGLTVVTYVRAPAFLPQGVWEEAMSRADVVVVQSEGWRDEFTREGEVHGVFRAVQDVGISATPATGPQWWARTWWQPEPESVNPTPVPALRPRWFSFLGNNRAK